MAEDYVEIVPLPDNLEGSITANKWLDYRFWQLAKEWRDDPTEDRLRRMLFHGVRTASALTEKLVAMRENDAAYLVVGSSLTAIEVASFDAERIAKRELGLVGTV